MNIPVILGNAANNFWYSFAFYSLWGTTTALLAIIFSNLATCYESFFRVAYITTEISYSVNIIVVLVFWLILWPMTLKYIGEMEEQGVDVTFFLWYNGIIHAVPFLTTIIDLGLTDMALEKSHWWIAFITMFPCYMIPNWIGSMTVGSVLEPGRLGNIYGVEMWDTNVPLTIVMFIAGGLLQAGLFYGTAACIDRIWPKRASEEFDLKESLIDDEKAANGI